MYSKISEIKDYSLESNNPLDVLLALEYLGNEEEVYNVAKREFIQNYKNAPRDILSYLNTKNYQQIKMLIHRIKGSSLYIGSKHLYEFSIYLNEKLYQNEKLKNNIINSELDQEINDFTSLMKNVLYHLSKN